MGKLFSVIVGVCWLLPRSYATNALVSSHTLLAETSCVSMVTMLIQPKSTNPLAQKLKKAKAEHDKKTQRAKDIAKKERLFAEYRTEVMGILKSDLPSVFSECEALGQVVDGCSKKHGLESEAASQCVDYQTKQRIEKIQEALRLALK